MRKAQPGQSNEQPPHPDNLTESNEEAVPKPGRLTESNEEARTRHPGRLTEAKGEAYRHSAPTVAKPATAAPTAPPSISSTSSSKNHGDLTEAVSVAPHPGTLTESHAKPGTGPIESKGMAALKAAVADPKLAQLEVPFKRGFIPF